MKKIGLTVLRLVLLLVAVTAVAFFLVESAPVDYVQSYVGAGEVVSTAQREEIRAQLQLDAPPLTRYLQWLLGALRLDLGQSLIYRQAVSEVITQRFWGSLMLMSLAWLFSGVLGFGLGLLLGRFADKPWERAVKSLCLSLSATPTFFLGMVFLMVFSLQLGWFPVGFSAPIGVLQEEVTLWQRLHHLALPALTLSLISCTNIALHTREITVTVLASDYVAFARSRNLSERKILLRHVLPNVLLPFVTLQFASLSELFGGSVLAETVFSYGGLGSCIVEAGLQGDSALLLGVTLVSGLFVFVGNATANLLYSWIDPRIGKNQIL